MSIAEEIYAEVQKLPDDLGREVLDFVYFIEERYTLRSKSESLLPPVRRRERVPGSAKEKLKVLVEDGQHLQDFRDYMP